MPKKGGLSPKAKASLSSNNKGIVHATQGGGKKRRGGGPTGLPANWYTGKAPTFKATGCPDADSLRHNLDVCPNASNLKTGGRRHVSMPSNYYSQQAKLSSMVDKLGKRTKGGKKSTSTKRNQKGGGSDWGFSQYSAGPINTLLILMLFCATKM